MTKAKKGAPRSEEKAGLVRIRESDKRILQQMAQDENSPMPEILRKALEAYRRQKFFDAVNVAYKSARDNPQIWQMEESERLNWEKVRDE